jgi:hypothetical protein
MLLKAMSCSLLIALHEYRTKRTTDGRATARFPPHSPGFEPESDHVGFVVDIVALGQILSEYFGFSCESLDRLLHTHLSYGAVAITKMVVAVA